MNGGLKIRKDGKGGQRRLDQAVRSGRLGEIQERRRKRWVATKQCRALAEGQMDRLCWSSTLRFRNTTGSRVTRPERLRLGVCGRKRADEPALKKGGASQREQRLNHWKMTQAKR
ncbi:hypothetical protein PHSY_007499 [Pseudozyma hubeiensis SY62]|uniref:Uncharacterized protein n=1 Tax=Pseudozyma hubeiensis (strain SY62) TaxID=1305764 RepID=R9PEY0_PSEHS|nr:hypothetical protein PHSY_007499 [Pseudozyma hubeiensis SY62]GAC99896.1 hypothetical protein PHSY_007499 [Pseudozyma hubeiensis SY62]